MTEAPVDPEILQLAREEAEERIGNFEKNLLELEAGTIGHEAIDELFRDAHSIKSAAAMLGWNKVVSIAHAMEDRLYERRESGANLEGLIDPLLRALDGGLEYPHYTRPREFRGKAVPDVLLGGDHAAIARWRREHRRPSPPPETTA